MNDIIFLQIKQSVIQDLKNINLEKQDREFLLNLIKLFDLLTENENEKFIKILLNLINQCETEKKEELTIRLRSLILQLEHNKFSEIKHFAHFSFYVRKEKVDIYIKKLALDWNTLFFEIEKIKFEEIRVIVYKTNTKKERITNVKLKKNDFKVSLLNILENNICSNIQITLSLSKEKLY